jgi:predicted MFS family arabinose efflux permease
MGVFDFLGTIGSGWLSDRFDSRHLLLWYYVLRGVALICLPFSGFGALEMSLFAVVYGLDWVSTVPPTLKLVSQRFSAGEASLVFGWIFAAHQVGAAMAAFGAGLAKTSYGAYLPALLVGGALSVAAGGLAVLIPSSPNPEAAIAE